MAAEITEALPIKLRLLMLFVGSFRAIVAERYSIALKIIAALHFVLILSIFLHKQKEEASASQPVNSTIDINAF